MTSQKQNDVRLFHVSMDHPAPTAPVQEITPELLDLIKKRVKWLHEEADELLEAAEAGDVVKMYDAIIDSLYFAYGTGVVLAWDLDPGWDIVQGTNMAKLNPVTGKADYNEDGKVMKPAGWIPPEALHAIELERQFMIGNIDALD